MTLTLKSICGDSATTGTLTAGALSLATIELPWRDNVPDRSCVPAGEYQLIPYLSPKHGRTWRLHAPELGVWGQGVIAPNGMRSEIEIHPGNFTSDSLGCLLVGLAVGEMLNPKTDDVEPAVLDSRPAFERLRELLEDSEDETLIIERNPPGEE